ncbi:hypothetical protein MP631_18425 [Xanthomonas phaseoli pv. phaseoli]|nr:hypothetical protein MP631_18425 [Xanthomonas phaseoli pv. phaseoli]
MPDDTQLRIASRLLGPLLCQHPTRLLQERMEDIQHSLDVAAELMRRRESGSSAPSSYDYAPPKPGDEVRTREAIIVRDMISQNDWRAKRQRGDDGDAKPSPRKKPTLH